MVPHPASLLVLWLAVLLAASALSGLALTIMFATVMLTAAVFAWSHLRALLRRSRWLLLTLIVLFGWATPGSPVSGVPGASIEGLHLATDHAFRLMLALAALALVLKLLTPVELVAGLRLLLAPLAVIGLPRDRLAVRVALTLEEVERSRNGSDQDPPDVLRLPIASFGAVDIVLGLAACAVLGTLWL